MNTAPEHRTSAGDERFRQAFESGMYAPADFNHAAHVRLAYVYLCAAPPDEAAGRMRSALLCFLAHHGIDAGKYHETMTRAWILAVHHFMQQSPASDSAAAFMEANPGLLDSRIMLTHYSADLLFSGAARAGFVEPDLDPIPRHEQRE